MVRIMAIAALVVGLLSPTLAAFCQLQCHFLATSQPPVTHQLLPSPTDRMECRANQTVVFSANSQASSKRKEFFSPIGYSLPFLIKGFSLIIFDLIFKTACLEAK